MTEIKITTPADMESEVSKLDVVLAKFEKKFSDETMDEEYYHLVIVGEYNRPTLDAVEEAYTNAGWSKVRCRTSREKGERAGLTELQLYRK